jgi:hypothetical protein
MTALAATLIVSFGLLLAIHAVGSVTLARDDSLWRGALAFVVPPIFPIFAIRAHHAAWAIVWCTAAATYATSLALAWSWR